jgi:hypothetical protein
VIALDRVVAHAQNAHAMASRDSNTASRIADFAGHAIRSWRDLAGLDEEATDSVGSVPLARDLQLT